MVRPQVYGVTSNLAANNVNWFFELGATINATINLFDAAANQNFNVWGRGNFFSTGNILRTTSGSNIYFEGLNAQSNADCFYIYSSSVTIDIKENIIGNNSIISFLSSTNVNTNNYIGSIDIAGGNVYISGEVSQNIFITGGDVNININNVIAGSGSIAIQILNSNVIANCQQIIGGGGISSSSGTGSDAGNALNISGSGNVIVNCDLITNGNGGNGGIGSDGGSSGIGGDANGGNSTLINISSSGSVTINSQAMIGGNGGNGGTGGNGIVNGSVTGITGYGGNSNGGDATLIYITGTGEVTINSEVMTGGSGGAGGNNNNGSNGVYNASSGSGGSGVGGNSNGGNATLIYITGTGEVTINSEVMTDGTGGSGGNNNNNGSNGGNNGVYNASGSSGSGVGGNSNGGSAIFIYIIGSGQVTINSEVITGGTGGAGGNNGSNSSIGGNNGVYNASGGGGSGVGGNSNGGSAIFIYIIGSGQVTINSEVMTGGAGNNGGNNSNFGGNNGVTNTSGSGGSGVGGNSNGGSAIFIYISSQSKLAINGQVISTGNGGNGGVAGKGVNTGTTGTNIPGVANGGDLTFAYNTLGKLYFKSNSLTITIPGQVGSTGSPGFGLGFYNIGQTAFLSADINSIVTIDPNNTLVKLYNLFIPSLLTQYPNPNNPASTLSFRNASLAGRLCYVYGSNLVIKGEYLSSSYSANSAGISSFQPEQGIIYLDGGQTVSTIPSMLDVNINRIDFVTTPNVTASVPIYLIQINGNHPPYGNSLVRDITPTRSPFNYLNTTFDNINIITAIFNAFIGYTNTARNDVGILYMDDPYTVHTNTIGYAYFPPPTTTVSYIAPAYHILRTPQYNDTSVYLAYTYNFGLMIRTKRISIPPGVLPTNSHDVALIFFDGLSGSSLASNSTLIEGEFVANDPGVSTFNNSSIVGLYGQTGILYVKNIVLVNKWNVGGQFSYYADPLNNTLLFIYGYSITNIADNGISYTSYVSPAPYYINPAIK